jgi:hypothetical protein
VARCDGRLKDRLEVAEVDAVAVLERAQSPDLKGVQKGSVPAAEVSEDELIAPACDRGVSPGDAVDRDGNVAVGGTSEDGFLLLQGDP